MSDFNFEEEISKMPLNENVKTLSFYGLCATKREVEASLGALQRLSRNSVIGITGLRLIITMRTQQHTRKWISEYKTSEAAVEALKDQFANESPNTTIREFQDSINSISPYANQENVDETEAPKSVVQEDDILSMWRNS